MLSNLRIENIAVIEKADISFDIGLNVMTGETGAGKSIIIDAINVILGERTSKELIRTGAQSASVSAYFENIGQNVVYSLNELEIPCEEDKTLLIQRKINIDGRNTCKVNGCPVTVTMLKQLGKSLVNIYGQNDSQFLLTNDNNIVLIDSLAQNEDILSQYQVYYKEYVKLKKELKLLTGNAQEKENEVSLLSFQISELEKADIKIGEIEKLEQYITKCKNSEKIAKSLNEATNYLYGSDEYDGIILNFKTIKNRLENVSDVFTQLDDDISKLTEITCLTEEIYSSISNKLNSIDFDKVELEKAEERLDCLLKLKRKYGNSEEEMLTFLENAKNSLSQIENSEIHIDKITEKLNISADKMIKYADKLSLSRKKAGEQFIEKIVNELSFLDMPGVRFKIKQEDKAFSLIGKDNIEILISPNEGENEKTLSKIASGGELSRIMLAIKNVASQNDNLETMIFDEIDTGVSGKTAEKIGIKLSEVSKQRQVICVTHSAQVASKSDNHLLIEKSTSNGHTYTQVRSLSEKERKYELARIIGGVVITQGQLKVAEEMLKGTNDDDTGKN